MFVKMPVLDHNGKLMDEPVYVNPDRVASFQSSQLSFSNAEEAVFATSIFMTDGGHPVYTPLTALQVKRVLGGAPLKDVV